MQTVLATDAAAEGLRALYETEYRRQFSKEIPSGEVEVLSWGLTVSATLATAQPLEAAAGAAPTTAPGVPAEPTGMAEVWDVAASAAMMVPLYPRNRLNAGGGG
eukprot:SAG22_NODE_12225_length_451_cov_1.053977_1_plen_103_part_01